MVRWHQSLAFLATLSTIQLAAATPISHPDTPLSRAVQKQPCQLIANKQAELEKQYPSATTFEIPAELAYDCLSTVPFKKNDALRLIDGLNSYFQWQSTIDYLKNPPVGYLLPAVDLDAGIASIRRKVTQNSYKSEFQFQSEISSLVSSMHDGHFDLFLDAMTIFSFQRRAFGPLASISQDGKQFPKIYSLNDLKVKNPKGWKPSAITKIDNIDVVQWLQHWSYYSTSQDPDALYNNLFYSIPSAATGSYGSFISTFGEYTGPQTRYTFENGTTKEVHNSAVFSESFKNVKDGESFYKTFCHGRLPQNLSKREETIQAYTRRPIHKRVEEESSRKDFPLSQSSMQAPDVAGYFLGGEHSDTAVLSIASFSAQSSNGSFLFDDFSGAVAKLLEVSKKEKKTKLIIDVTGNGGGALFLAYDVFKQLFPDKDPDDASNVRATEQIDVIGRVITDLLRDKKSKNTPEAEFQIGGEFDIEVYNNAQGKKFKNWGDYYGPERVGNLNFTNLAAWDFNNKNLGKHIVAGYQGRSKLPPQVFKPENIVLLTDGICASTCAVLADLLQRNGVKSVVMGGRPRDGPVQAVGGVKGAQVLRYVDLYVQALLVLDSSNLTPQEKRRLEATDLGELKRSGKYVMARTYGDGKGGRINYRNAVRKDDKTRMPRQFVNEPADCRLWYTKETLLDMEKLWATVANVAWGKGECTPSSSTRE
ncbi:hypothetical protein FQN57_002207 [Myotisia sp. PD_48]|nr:hypothetical protein FQN57_002207 [Myotisia sp. PD_48]